MLVLVDVGVVFVVMVSVVNVIFLDFDIGLGVGKNIFWIVFYVVFFVVIWDDDLNWLVELNCLRKILDEMK